MAIIFLTFWVVSNENFEIRTGQVNSTSDRM